MASTVSVFLHSSAAAGSTWMVSFVSRALAMGILKLTLKRYPIMNSYSCPVSKTCSGSPPGVASLKQWWVSLRTDGLSSCSNVFPAIAVSIHAESDGDSIPDRTAVSLNHLSALSRVSSDYHALLAIHPKSIEYPDPWPSGHRNVSIHWLSVKTLNNNSPTWLFRSRSTIARSTWDRWSVMCFRAYAWSASLLASGGRFKARRQSKASRR
ncbi:hypothetical protein BDW62DRAFT_3533 [Aspergillus aurantiobrunneus]